MNKDHKYPAEKRNKHKQIKLITTKELSNPFAYLGSLGERKEAPN